MGDLPTAQKGSRYATVKIVVILFILRFSSSRSRSENEQCR